MKHIRTIALAAMTALALLAIGVGSASATTLENTKGEHVTKFTASVVGSAELTAAGEIFVDTCAGGSVTGESSNTGSATETVRGPVSAANLTWSNCTNTTKTLAGGELEIHHIAGTSNGTITGTTFEVTVVAFGVSCVYGLSSTDNMVHLGTLTGHHTTPVIDINTTVPRRSGSFLCPASATWKATYHITDPTDVTVTSGA